MDQLKQQGEKFKNQIIDQVNQKGNFSYLNIIYLKVDNVIIQMNEHRPDYQFYLFINPSSGGNRAGELLHLQAESILFQFPKNKNSTDTLEVEIKFFSLKTESSRTKGFQTLRTEQLRNVNTYVIVCGGDGTVMWCVDLMIKNQIDFSKCPIGIMPFGTGNDFSRVLGWGPDTSIDLGNKLHFLKKHAHKWMSAVIDDFDVWEVKMETYPVGYFRKIEKTVDGFIKKHLQENNQDIKVMKKYMANYFSFGVESRIGYGFDKKRSTSACCNKLVYCCEGFKKMFLKTPQTNSILESMEIIKSKEDSQVENATLKGNTEVLFQTRIPHQVQQNNPQQQNENVPFLKGNPVTILCLNIPSFSGGAGDAWGACHNNIGLENLQKQTINKQFEPMKINDGKIEFVSFNSVMGLGNERFLHGQAQRVAQGGGPFLFRFYENTPLLMQVNTYLQIDGEYYQIIHPKQIKLKPLRKVPNGKIKVLIEKDQAKKIKK